MNATPLRTYLTYALLAMPVAFAGMPLYVHAPDFYATNMGVSLSALAIMLLLLRVVDAIQDPLIGRWSDQWDERRPVIMCVAACVLVVSFAALFYPPQHGHALLWFAGCMLLATTSYSILTINMQALGAGWASSARPVTNIMSWREGFGLLGLLMAVSLPALFMPLVGASNAYMVVGIILAVLMLVGMGCFVRWHQHHASSKVSDTVHHFTIRGKGWFFATYVVSMLASSVPALLVMFYIRDRLDLEAYAGAFLFLYFASTAITLPCWNWLASRTNYVTAWGIGMGFAVISFVWAFFLGSGDWLAYGMVCFVSGMALGADLVMPPSILAAQLKQRNEYQHAHAHYGVLTFGAKLALALASLVALPALEWAGYIPGDSNDAYALWALSAAYALIPCVIKLLSIAMLWHWYSTQQDKGVLHEQAEISHTMSRRLDHA